MSHKGEIEIYIQSDHSDDTNGEDELGDKEKVPPRKCVTNSGISESGTLAVITKSAIVSDPISEINSIANNICKSIKVSKDLFLSTYRQ